MVKYAEIAWTAEDVQSLRPRWSLKRCHRFLRENGKNIQDRSVERGWEVIEDLIAMEEAEEKRKNKKKSNA